MTAPNQAPTKTAAVPILTATAVFEKQRLIVHPVLIATIEYGKSKTTTIIVVKAIRKGPPYE